MRARRRIANEVIGAAVRRQRRMSGWTQEDLADRVGVSRTAMTNIEAGRHGVSIDQLIDLTDALGMSLPLLFAEIRRAWRKDGQGH